MSAHVIVNDREHRAATTSVRSRSAGRALVRRVKKAGGTALILRKNRRDGTWPVFYVLPVEIRARDVGITHDVGVAE